VSKLKTITDLSILLEPITITTVPPENCIDVLLTFFTPLFKGEVWI
jgi:hypothetical protein